MRCFINETNAGPLFQDKRQIYQVSIMYKYT